MVRGGRTGRGSTSIGRGVHLPDYAGCPSDRVRLPDYAGCPGDRVRLPDYAGCPDDRSREPSSSGGGGGSATWTRAMLDFWGEDRSRFCFPLYYLIGARTRSRTSGLMERVPPVRSGIRRYMFTRPEDLPRARVVRESTAQNNFRKSMWEARDKAVKTTGSQDPTAWMDYGPVWMRRDYWESLCHRWATGPWQERSQAAKRNRAAHPENNVHTSGSASYATHNQKLRHELERAPTFRELFDWTHKRKGTDDYVSESARTIAESYDRTMADRYAESTPQPYLDPEAWVDAAGGARKGRVYDFGDSMDTTPVLSSYASSVAPPAYASSSAVMPDSGGEDMRTLIREELQLHFGAMVEHLISAIRGVGPS
ncbi:hypothetical protein Taro_052001 [Colocasia esculenta]|uniref:Uncharacterized protein n=1 Tax=Colocasia esculenta TaxID=4460 RepID=A0A843XIG9_COLES|nr:hypothetical protein [Colocasia esculenta]